MLLLFQLWLLLLPAVQCWAYLRAIECPQILHPKNLYPNSILMTFSQRTGQETLCTNFATSRTRVLGTILACYFVQPCKFSSPILVKCVYQPCPSLCAYRSRLNFNSSSWKPCPYEQWTVSDFMQPLHPFWWYTQICAAIFTNFVQNFNAYLLLTCWTLLATWNRLHHNRLFRSSSSGQIWPQITRLEDQTHDFQTLVSQRALRPSLYRRFHPYRLWSLYSMSF